MSDETATVDEQTSAPSPSDEGEDELEQHAVERDGQKLIPLSEAAKARQQAREAKEENERLQAQVKDAERLKQFAQQATPVIEALRNRPDVLQALIDPKATPKQKEAAEEQDPELAELVKTLDLYDSAGQPDSKRGKTIEGFIQKRVQKAIEDAITPLKSQTATDKATQNYQWMLSREHNGKPLDKQYVDAVVNQMSAEQLADGNAAANAWLMALGMAQAHKEQRTVKPPDDEPVFTESAGGRPSAIRLGDFEKKVAQREGISEKDFLNNIKQAAERGGALE